MQLATFLVGGTRGSKKRQFGCLVHSELQSWQKYLALLQLECEGTIDPHEEETELLTSNLDVFGNEAIQSYQHGFLYDQNLHKDKASSFDYQKCEQTYKQYGVINIKVPEDILNGIKPTGVGCA